MPLSVLELFSIGVGPSSSHTVGPMRAALRFVRGLERDDVLACTARVRVQLYGSLGATGRGHASDRAIVLGLLGETPEDVETDRAPALVQEVRDTGRLTLAGGHVIAFDPDADLLLHRGESLPAHPNGMRFEAFDAHGTRLAERVCYSVGGGFVVDEGAAADGAPEPARLTHAVTTAGDLLEACARTGRSVAQLTLENERAWRSDAETRAALLHVWRVMRACIERGCSRTEPTLPGPLRVPRRAPDLCAKLRAEADATALDPMRGVDWVNLFALAVNEENASGGRVVTAPTNGAAGIVPAVLAYLVDFCGGDDDRVVEYLLTAGAIGILFKENASISGAEVGCQGEVGSACSMAAGALCAALGGSPQQVENAAEIGIEHHLGLTCDPVGGLVQIPCIERNAIAAVTAINAARLALQSDGTHTVTLDQAIATMRDTGRDMQDKYKETSRGGLAVNVIEC